MKSGLEDRNNVPRQNQRRNNHDVSMKSGLEDRNNDSHGDLKFTAIVAVSMKSGLEDRNNPD